MESTATVSDHWEFQDPKMEVYTLVPFLRPYFLGIFPKK
jgi:hypothetical protein